jgi:hypothetical protein
MIDAFHAVKILEKDQQRKGSKIEVSRLKKHPVFCRIEMGVDFGADFSCLCLINQFVYLYII